MIRTVFAVATIAAIALGACVAVAQEDPIKAPTQFQDAAAKMPGLYPDNTKDGDPSDQFNASPKVWENMADFKARFVKFGDDAKASTASVTDVDSLKTALGNIGKNDCGACHQDYRLKKG